MYESDDDRLAMIRALGGIEFIGPRGKFWAVFEQPAVALGDLAVVTPAPQLTARTSDLERAAVVSGGTVRRNSVSYLVRQLLPDGTGMTVVDLDTP